MVAVVVAEPPLLVKMVMSVVLNWVEQEVQVLQHIHPGVLLLVQDKMLVVLDGMQVVAVVETKMMFIMLEMVVLVVVEQLIVEHHRLRFLGRQTLVVAVVGVPIVEHQQETADLVSSSFATLSKENSWHILQK